MTGSLYKSQCVVRAFKISRTENGKIYGENGEAIKPLRSDFFQRHSPHAGAYFVMYEDDYQSVCPAESFESGYVELMHVPDGAPDWFVRLTAEYADLGERCLRLKLVLSSSPSGISLTSLELLQEQFNHMERYLDVLARRIDLCRMEMDSPEGEPQAEGVNSVEDSAADGEEVPRDALTYSPEETVCDDVAKEGETDGTPQKGDETFHPSDGGEGCDSPASEQEEQSQEGVTDGGDLPAPASTYPVHGDDVHLASAGVSDYTRRVLESAGYQTVGDVREAFKKTLEDGGCLQDMVGVTRQSSSEIEQKLLNDRPAGNYLTGESAGEVPAE